MSAKRLREAGFTVRLKPGDVIGIAPVELLTDEQRQWIKSKRDTLLAELQSEAVANDATEVERRCSECKHDVRSAHNPTGGLTYCRVRDDIPMMLPRARLLQCSRFSKK